MKTTNAIYTVRGLSHQPFAKELCVWFPKCIGQIVSVSKETADQNEIHVDCMAVYQGRNHIGYIADLEKEKMFNILAKSGRRTLPANIISYDEGKGEEKGWSQAKLTIELLPTVFENLSPNVIPEKPIHNAWKKWTTTAPPIMLSEKEKQLNAVFNQLIDMAAFNEPWDDNASRTVEDLCQLGYIDISKEMREQTALLVQWLENGDNEEQKEAAARVEKMLSNLGSGEYYDELVKIFVYEKTECNSCLENMTLRNFSIDKIHNDIRKMPYQMVPGKEKNFIARLLYESIPRKKINQIFSCYAYANRWKLQQEQEENTNRQKQDKDDNRHLEVSFEPVFQDGSHINFILGDNHQIRKVEKFTKQNNDNQ